MLFRAIICMLIFIKKAIYKRFFFIFAPFCTILTIFSVSIPPVFCHFNLHFIIFRKQMQHTDIQSLTFAKPFL